MKELIKQNGDVINDKVIYEMFMLETCGSQMLELKKQEKEFRDPNTYIRKWMIVSYVNKFEGKN